MNLKKYKNDIIFVSYSVMYFCLCLIIKSVLESSSNYTEEVQGSLAFIMIVMYPLLGLFLANLFGWISSVFKRKEQDD